MWLRYERHVVARSQNDLDLWLAASDPLSETESVHLAGQLDFGKDGIDLGITSKDCCGFL